MWLVVGLGNPGERYAQTRHNVGFDVVDALARAHATKPWSSKWKGENTEMRLGGEAVLLVKPQTFMNLTGEAVQPALTYYKIPLDHLIAIHDDLDLPIGTVRLKLGGGAGGHNGLKSIDQHLGPAYLRVRIGIGHPGDRDRVSGYVLNRFSADERAAVDGGLVRAADAVKLLIERGLTGAQAVIHMSTEPRANKTKPTVEVK